MKHSIVWIVVLLLCAACNDNKEERLAAPLHDEAQKAYDEMRYEDALQWIDSVKSAYPKAFETRQKGVDLKSRIIIAQAQQTVATADSMRIELQQEIRDMQSKLILVKNKKYEESGNYFYPSQVDLPTSNRSYLRAQVGEDGVFTLTSVFHGASAIRHNRVRITAPDGTSAETETGSPYTSKNGSATTEKVDYLVEQNAAEAARFITDHQNENLHLEFIGTGATPVSFPLPDRKGIATVFRLYEKEDQLNKLTKVKEDALLKIRFYTEKGSQKEQK